MVQGSSPWPSHHSEHSAVESSPPSVATECPWLASHSTSKARGCACCPDSSLSSGQAVTLELHWVPLCREEISTFLGSNNRSNNGRVFSTLNVKWALNSYIGPHLSSSGMFSNSIRRKSWKKKKANHESRLSVTNCPTVPATKHRLFRSRVWSHIKELTPHCPTPLPWGLSPLLEAHN